jgi:hypothetical protein
MTTLTPDLAKPNLGIFHSFELVYLPNGNVTELTQIGSTREAAEFSLRQFNLKGLDWSKYELRSVEELAA